VAFSPDGSKVLTGSSDGVTKLWDISDVSILNHRFEIHNNRNLSIKYERNNSLLFISPALSSHQNSTLTVYTITGRNIAQYFLDNAKEKSNHQCILPANLGTGTYLFRYLSGGITVKGTFAIVK
jgi:WD40 repeat protein